jgi:hypothetical protein
VDDEERQKAEQELNEVVWYPAALILAIASLLFLLELFW